MAYSVTVHYADNITVTIPITYDLEGYENFQAKLFYNTVEPQRLVIEAVITNGSARFSLTGAQALEIEYCDYRITGEKAGVSRVLQFGDLTFNKPAPPNALTHADWLLQLADASTEVSIAVRKLLPTLDEVDQTARDSVAARLDQFEYIVRSAPIALEVRGDSLYSIDSDGNEINVGVVQGPKGDKGDQGFQGIQGVQGQQGIQGPVGPAGLDWKGVWSNTTTYDQNDAVYYDGASWFASSGAPAGTIPSEAVNNPWQPLAVRGAQGIQGQQGIQGIQGTQGVKGDSGDLTPVNNSPASGTANLAGVTFTPPVTRIVTLTANLTFANLPPAPPAGFSATTTIVVKQAASGGPYTVTWPTAIEWANDAAAPVMPTVANSELVVHLFWTGTACRAMVGGIFYP